MERLTKRLSDGTISVNGANINQHSRSFVRQIAERLAEFEDIGLNPSEIKSLLHDGGIEIAVHNQKLRQQVAELEDEREHLVELCCTHDVPI